MAFVIELDNYQGPFDVLLDLLKKRRLDITELSLGTITNDYLEITITMKVIDDKVFFTYKDSGKGLFSEKPNNSGFGLSLINTLSKQLKGIINYPKANHFLVEIEFPIKNIKQNINTEENVIS